LTDLRKVNTSAARYQQLSLNPQKLAGQCGKLKCCLNYELDTYLDALQEFPKQETLLKTKKGLATFVKMDIFKGLLWYTYKENRLKWYKLTLDQVNEIIQLNKKGEAISSLEEYEADMVVEAKVDFENKNNQKSAQNKQKQTTGTSKKKRRRPPNKRANNIKNV
jgi:hypothetical protein